MTSCISDLLSLLEDEMTKHRDVFDLGCVQDCMDQFIQRTGRDQAPAGGSEEYRYNGNNLTDCDYLI